MSENPTDEIDRLRDELETLRNCSGEELERQKLDALAEFAAGAGHEINNPLAIIGGHAQLLLREIEHPEHRRQLALIAAQVQRAYDMIADIRLFARPPAPESETFSLLDWLRALVGEQRPRMEEAGVVLHFTPEIRVFEPDGSVVTRNLEQHPVFLSTDPAMLGVVVSALCRNAREALMPGGGEIGLTVCRRDGFWEIGVEDNGPGVSDEIRPLIFCPYFSGRQAGRGLGFGLSKAWRFMQLLGGHVRHETPTSGVGSLFVAAFP